jgi:hypothetical protein
MRKRETNSKASRKSRELGSDNSPNFEAFSMRSQVLTSSKPASKAQMRAKSTMGVMAWFFRSTVPACAPLWLLDEPFDALDGDGIDALNAVIGDHALAGGCVLLTSHQALSIRQPVPMLLDLEAFAPAPRQALRRGTLHETGHVADR